MHTNKTRKHNCLHTWLFSEQKTTVYQTRNYNFTGVFQMINQKMWRNSFTNAIVVKSSISAMTEICNITRVITKLKKKPKQRDEIFYHNRIYSKVKNKKNIK